MWTSTQLFALTVRLLHALQFCSSLAIDTTSFLPTTTNATSITTDPVQRMTPELWRTLIDLGNNLFGARHPNNPNRRLARIVSRSSPSRSNSVTVSSASSLDELELYYYTHHNFGRLVAFRTKLNEYDMPTWRGSLLRYIESRIVGETLQYPPLFDIFEADAIAKAQGVRGDYLRVAYIMASFPPTVAWQPIYVFVASDRTSSWAVRVDTKEAISWPPEGGLTGLDPGLDNTFSWLSNVTSLGKGNASESTVLERVTYVDRTSTN